MARKADVEYPKVGSAAPRFALLATGGQTIKLADYRGKSTVVLFFYPKDMTSGCTKEACGFRDAHAALTKAGVAVLGISPDPVRQHEKFIEKHGLNFPLLADEDHKVAEAYGVWREKSLYGREYMGIVRTTFVIDRDGKIAHVFENVKADGHAEEVRAWMQGSETV